MNTIYFENGRQLGLRCQQAIAENIHAFWQMVEQSDLSPAAMECELPLLIPTIAKKRYAEICGIAKGAGVALQDLLLYNLFQPQIFPEGCTVYFAAGAASSTGATIFGKNSDKSGNERLTGEGCHDFHEINVVSYFENEDGSHVVGVSSAGTTGIKMGLNSHGVAAGTNFGRSNQVRKKALSTKDKFAGDRAQLARDGLSYATALEAAQFVASRLIERPMASSGMIEFADADSVYVVENVYDYVCVHKVTDAVDSRSNYFSVLAHLNEEGNASCYCRYHRSQQLLSQLVGTATVDDMKRISMDHHEGTQSLAICRHNSGLESSTQSAMVAEINREHPEKSIIHIALGRPCSAWRQADGHIAITMDTPRDQIPEEFLSGLPYVKYCSAPPVD